MKNGLIRILMLLAALSFAQVNISRIEERLSRFNVYLTKNGDEVTIVMPIESIFSGQTTFVQDESGPLIEALVGLIAQSKGMVQLEAMVVPTEGVEQALNSSIAYTQVVELSKVLLQGGGQISYAPLTVKLQPRNDSYGFWKRYQRENTFIQMSLSID
ncbi:hypothetical protein OAT84_03585 [Gammaproteobacteria bacterium]|nr:hypothetical protein [Gammaproteobacteria bacterium]